MTDKQESNDAAVGMVVSEFLGSMVIEQADHANGDRAPGNRPGEGRNARAEEREEKQQRSAEEETARAERRLRRQEQRDRARQGETLTDFLGQPDDEYDWLVEDLLERADRLIVTGDEGAGKSTLLVQLAVQVAAGVHPWTLKAVDPRRVLYVDLEQSPRQLRRRLRPLAKIAGSRLDQNLFAVAAVGGAVDVRTVEDLTWLSELVARWEAELLVVGPIYKLAGGDPTTEEHARAVTRVLDELRDVHDVTIITEAHRPHAPPGKGGKKNRPKRPYGASLWTRWPEFGICLDGEPGSRSMTLSHWRGQREERAWPDVLFRGDTGEWPWLAPETAGDQQPRREATWADVVTAIRDAGKLLTIRALAETTGASKSTVQRAINANRTAWDDLRAEYGDTDQDDAT